MRNPVCNSVYRRMPAAVLLSAPGHLMTHDVCEVTLSAAHVRSVWMLKVERAEIFDCDVILQVFDGQLDPPAGKPLLVSGFLPNPQLHHIPLYCDIEEKIFKTRYMKMYRDLKYIETSSMWCTSTMDVDVSGVLYTNTMDGDVNGVLYTNTMDGDVSGVLYTNTMDGDVNGEVVEGVATVNCGSL
ncbi:hypothetical protein Btru_053583 [Bulinus truncatus]|nr:hypothetical protein Btru_053583 [Bulinus truncatus]